MAGYEFRTCRKKIAKKMESSSALRNNEILLNGRIGNHCTIREILFHHR